MRPVTISPVSFSFLSVVGIPTSPLLLLSLITQSFSVLLQQLVAPILMLPVIRILPFFVLAQHQNQRVFAVRIGHRGGDCGLAETIRVLIVDIVDSAVGEVAIGTALSGGSQGLEDLEPMVVILEFEAGG
ncbi:uncharacterized protein M421DRAFT_415875 [Didymella exigua CBS 183.55]|uniref:Uncharacterized protein n=1 Tax=Didymella exigua CBS 183.55 TaxID=1150837 RepID=A0A6A5S0X5_9PLEO|nr:uncharacterized protein M421DRAFT_415875 [Didymella exigua CBS 183.55]KAF1933533.1 hypothetical protein M421DRAFT_415875 [Didymella exigua CBS 183.55]